LNRWSRSQKTANSRAISFRRPSNARFEPARFAGQRLPFSEIGTGEATYVASLPKKVGVVLPP
jgi:hypothetical protein